jgi:hypothetical protein
VLLAVHDRLNYQGRRGDCALDAGPAFRRLGVRGKWRDRDDCRREGYGDPAQVQRVTSAEKVPRSVMTLNWRGPSAWMRSG